MNLLGTVTMSQEETVVVVGVLITAIFVLVAIFVYFGAAQEAAAELGVSLATLYAYASRGMLRSESVPGDPRARRYPREDVVRLKERKELRKEPERRYGSAAALAEGLWYQKPISR